MLQFRSGVPRPFVLHLMVFAGGKIVALVKHVALRFRAAPADHLFATETKLPPFLAKIATSRGAGSDLQGSLAREKKGEGRSLAYSHAHRESLMESTFWREEEEAAFLSRPITHKFRGREKTHTPPADFVTFQFAAWLFAVLHAATPIGLKPPRQRFSPPLFCSRARAG